MKYLLLLRGINVGGKNLIRMNDLKQTLTDIGLTGVQTYIQSGNIIFETEISDTTEITQKIKKNLADKFQYNSELTLIGGGDLQKIIRSVPREWKTGNDIRCYVAFVIKPATPENIAPKIHPKEGVDSLKTGPGVLYLTTLLSGITKSGFSRMVGTDYYKFLTIRNFNTVRKLSLMMQSD